MRKSVNLFFVALTLSLLPMWFQPSEANPSAARAQTATRSWLIRLVPPRATFAEDATPAEQAVMQQHVAYWKDLNDKGVCTFGGPVLDPNGAYGILVVHAATEDEARALAEGDPSVKAGVSRMEIAEMRVTFTSVHHALGTRD